MKAFLVTLIMFTSFGYAQEGAGNTQTKPPRTDAKEDKPETASLRRLESVSWDPVRSELSWTVSVWDAGVSLERPSAQEQYVIHLNDATMEFQGETRHFDTTEARRVRYLMDIISGYAVESTVWWGNGGSTPDPEGTPLVKDDPDQKLKEQKEGDEKGRRPSPKPATTPAGRSVASKDSTDTSTPSRALHP